LPFFAQRETRGRSKIEKDMMTENGTRHAVARLNYFVHTNIQSNLQRRLTLAMHGIELMEIVYGIFASVFRFMYNENAILPNFYCILSRTKAYRVLQVFLGLSGGCFHVAI
jgi:hypothetical protein